MTIQVIAGVAIFNDGKHCQTITRNDGPVTLPAEKERMFVVQGVAEYVDATRPPVEVVETVDPVEVVETVETVDESPTYETMSLNALKKECKARGLSFKSRAGRDELINLLTADDEPPAIAALGVA